MTSRLGIRSSSGIGSNPLSLKFYIDLAIIFCLSSRSAISGKTCRFNINRYLSVFQVIDLEEPTQLFVPFFTLLIPLQHNIQ